MYIHTYCISKLVHTVLQLTYTRYIQYVHIRLHTHSRKESIHKIGKKLVKCVRKITVVHVFICVYAQI
jgi:hypothetical protein